MHHRKNRSQLGKWHPANIIHVCVECHQWIGDNRLDAKSLGLALLPYEDPAEVPIRTGKVPFLLNDEGDYVPCNSNEFLPPFPGWAR
jgi:hypothetical protein